MINRDERKAELTKIRRLKMARSPHAYVRGATKQFYEWLAEQKGDALPVGPTVWICGDCHVGNLGPIADPEGRVRVQIRDLDQTVVGNPAHDLIRLGLSLASTVRGSALPGVTTARMVETMVEAYELAFEPHWNGEGGKRTPGVVQSVIRRSNERTWRHLAEERIVDVTPHIPLGKRFWPIDKEERDAIADIGAELADLATSLESRRDNAKVDVLDAAYWVKGCSSLGLTRFAVLLGVGKERDGRELCLLDVKEAMTAAAPSLPGIPMPRSNGERVVEGARNLSPNLGRRMRSTMMLGKSFFIRELLPQDLKLEVERLTSAQTLRTARYLAGIVGRAHSRQMNVGDRKAWQKELSKNRSRSLDAPSWLWTAIVALLASHESAYLQHCRSFALQDHRKRSAKSG